MQVKPNVAIEFLFKEKSELIGIMEHCLDNCSKRAKRFKICFARIDLDGMICEMRMSGSFADRESAEYYLKEWSRAAGWEEIA